MRRFLARESGSSTVTTMPIRFRCAYCNQLLGIARRKAGTVVRCPTCAGQVVVPQTDVAAGDGAVKPSNGAEQPLFERSDFDELFKPSEPDDPAVIGPRPVATAPPVEAPAGAWGTHAEPAYAGLISNSEKFARVSAFRDTLA